MSGITKAVGKVFSAVGSIVKKVWKPLVIAAAVYFTGGLALGAMGAAGAAGGEAALAAGAADLGGAGVLTAEGAAAAGIGADAAAAGAIDLGGTAALASGAADAGAIGAATDLGGAGVLASGVSDASGIAGDASGIVGQGADLSSVGQATAGFQPTAYPGANSGLDFSQPYGGQVASGANYAGGPTSAAATTDSTSSLWDKALGVTKSIMGTPGVPSLIGGFAQSTQQSQMMNAQLKYMQAHEPGQFSGSGAAESFKGMTPPIGTSAPTPIQLPALTPYTANAAQSQPFSPIPTLHANPQPLPGANQSIYTAPFPGYGTPGYGMQFPHGVPPSEQGLLSEQTPFIDSPYDQSYI